MTVSTIAKLCSIAFSFYGFSVGQRSDGQYWPCNPLKNATGACTPNRGLASSTYSIDFTKQTALPQDWSISNYATVNYGPLGAEFTFAKRYDAPQLWTDFYILFGKVKVNMQIAPGAGIISSAVLISDDFDEIDYEFSGNNFGRAGSTGMGQNNYFGKGITGSYDRGSFFSVASPQNTFHTYEVDWTPDSLTWLVDGQVVRTLLMSQTDNGAHQYPQTPSKLQLGLWDGGDPDQNSGTKAWAGGLTDFSQVPFTFYVKSVEIENMYPATAYNYTDQSGRWNSIQLLQQDTAVPPTTTDQPSVSLNAPVANSSMPSTTPISSTTTSTSAPTVVPGTSTEKTSASTSLTWTSTTSARTSSPAQTLHSSSVPFSSTIPSLHSATIPPSATASTKSSSHPATIASFTPTTSSQPIGHSSSSSKIQISTHGVGSTLSTHVKSSTPRLTSTKPSSSTCTSKTSNTRPLASTTCSEHKKTTSTRILPTLSSTTCTGQTKPSDGWPGWAAGYGSYLNRWGLRYGRLPVFPMDHAGNDH